MQQPCLLLVECCRFWATFFILSNLLNFEQRFKKCAFFENFLHIGIFDHFQSIKWKMNYYWKTKWSLNLVQIQWLSEKGLIISIGSCMNNYEWAKFVFFLLPQSFSLSSSESFREWKQFKYFRNILTNRKWFQSFGVLIEYGSSCRSEKLQMLVKLPSEMNQREVFRKILAFAIHFKALACQNSNGKEIVDWITIITAILAY